VVLLAAGCAVGPADRSTVSSRPGDTAGPAIAMTPPLATSTADTPSSDTAVPDTAVPNTAVPDTAVPDTAVPDTAVPDTATPDTARPAPVPEVPPAGVGRPVGPATGGDFKLTVTTAGGDLVAPVAPFTATIRRDGTAEPIDPPRGSDQEWLTAAWITQSAWPASPAQGRSYLYGHACRHHDCSFTRLADAGVGDTVTVSTTTQLLSYRICARGLSAKSGDLVVPDCGTGSSGDLVLVTCEFERGDVSTANLVLTATLTSAAAR
jgi:hypothetical protein